MPHHGASPFMKLFEERSKNEKGGGGGVAGKGGADGAVGGGGKGGKEGSQGSRPNEGRKRKQGISQGVGDAKEERGTFGDGEADNSRKRGRHVEEARGPPSKKKKKKKQDVEAMMEQARGETGRHGTAGVVMPLGRGQGVEMGSDSIVNGGGVQGDGEKRKRKKRKGRHGGKGGAHEDENEDRAEVEVQGNAAKSGNLNGQQHHGAQGGKDHGALGSKDTRRWGNGDGGGRAESKEKREKKKGGSHEEAGQDNDAWGVGQGMDKAFASGEYPFEADDADHAETPVEAYRDIAPVLARLAEALGKTKATLRVYDPYFCAGGVVKRLAKYGFKKVYNRCEDFYEMIETVRACSPCTFRDLVLHTIIQLSSCWDSKSAT